MALAPDEVFTKIGREQYYLWRAVDHEGEVLEAHVTKKRNKVAALKFLKNAMKRLGNPEIVVIDRCPPYRAAMKVVGNKDRQETKASPQQSRQELPPSVPKTGAGDAAFPRNAKFAEIRFSAFVSPQSFQSPAKYRREGQVQTTTCPAVRE
nr:DDE-type integrase/transposase/recombinase [Hyphomonas sediminis]